MSRFCSVLIVLSTVLAHSNSFALDDPFIIFEENGIQLWSEPNEPPAPSLFSTNIVARSTDPDATDIITFDVTSFSGDLFQVGIPTAFGTTFTTPLRESFDIVPEWADYDSHFLVEHNRSFCPSQAGLAEAANPIATCLRATETNDDSSPISAFTLPVITAPTLPVTAAPPILGIGDIDVDTFFFNNDEDSPDFVALDEIEIAQLVGVSDMRGYARMESTILGIGFSQVGVDVSIPLFSVPEPAGLSLVIAGLITASRMRRWATYR